MVKGFKIISRVFFILALVTFGAAVVLPGVLGKSATDTTTGSASNFEAVFGAAILLSVGLVICVYVGALLTTVKSETACKIGHGLLIGGYVLALTTALPMFGDSLAASVMCVSAVLFALNYAALLVVAILRRGNKESLNPAEDQRIIQVKEWKAIMDEGIISKEEYEEKRLAILGLKAKNAK